MQRYNLVYRPADSDLAGRCVDYAQNFKAIAADYLLDGVCALPHVTLCQFNAEPDELSSLWKHNAAALPERLSLSFDQFYVTDYNDGFLWLGFSVKRDPALIRFQAEAASILSKSGNRILFTGSGDAFFPHLTLARIAKAQAVASPVFSRLHWLDNFYGRPYDFCLSLGLSDQNGVFLSDIFPDAEARAVT